MNSQNGIFSLREILPGTLTPFETGRKSENVIVASPDMCQKALEF